MPFSLPPDAVVVAPTSEPARLRFERPERVQGELDLRNHIKKAVEAAQLRDRQTVRTMHVASPIAEAPPVERLSLLPSIRRFSSQPSRVKPGGEPGIVAHDGELAQTLRPGQARQHQRVIGVRVTLTLVFVTLLVGALVFRTHRHQSETLAPQKTALALGARTLNEPRRKRT